LRSGVPPRPDEPLPRPEDPEEPEGPKVPPSGVDPDGTLPRPDEPLPTTGEPLPRGVPPETLAGGSGTNVEPPVEGLVEKLGPEPGTVEAAPCPIPPAPPAAPTPAPAAAPPPSGPVLLRPGLPVVPPIPGSGLPAPPWNLCAFAVPPATRAARATASDKHLQTAKQRRRAATACSLSCLIETSMGVQRSA
jgi:hypothetical protein